MLAASLLFPIKYLHLCNMVKIALCKRLSLHLSMPNLSRKAYFQFWIIEEGRVEKGSKSVYT